MKCSDLSAPFIFQGGTPISQLPVMLSCIPKCARPGRSRHGPYLVIPPTKLHNLTLKIARRTALLSGLIPSGETGNELAEASQGPRAEESLESLVLCTTGGGAPYSWALPGSGKAPCGTGRGQGGSVPNISPQLSLPKVCPCPGCTPAHTMTHKPVVLLAR